MKEKIEDMKWEAITRFFDRVFDDPDAFPDKAVIFAWTDEELTRLFTKEKLRIMRTIRESKPKTVKELAKILKREVSAVSRDLKILEDMGIVRLERKGRKVKPLIDKKVLILPLISIEPQTIEQYERRRV
jgi:predicted transcriptional regulator